MASKYQRHQQWWVKLRHPKTGKIIRESLETTDEARAELLRQRLDLEVALLEPRFQMVDVPERLRLELEIPAESKFSEDRSTALEPKTLAPSSLLLQAQSESSKRAKVDDVVKAYLRFIIAENAPLHVANKVSMLRRFLGTVRVEKSGGPAKSKRRRAEDGKSFLPDPAPFFTGTYLDEMTPALIQDFLEGLGVGRKTMRHYREMFHHFFEFALKFDLYTPKNWHRPNPIAALPGYLSRNRRIVFLTQEEVDQQTSVLAVEPAIQIAALIMIHAGLRRAETLWLTKDSIAPDHHNAGAHFLRFPRLRRRWAAGPPSPMRL